MADLGNTNWSYVPELADVFRPLDPGAVQLYGWDSRTETWHGPTELSRKNPAGRRFGDTLRRASDTSWHGQLACPGAPGEPGGRFFAVINDLGDSATAMIYGDSSRTGPLEIVAVVPAERRARLRAEFAFEFVAYARFLRTISEGAELAVHDHLGAALSETGTQDSLVFSISTGLGISDFDDMLSRCTEKVALGMLEWLENRD